MKRLQDEADAQRRLVEYLDAVGDVLGNRRRRASFATYAAGLLGEGDRKSLEPIVGRAFPDPRDLEMVYDRVHNFLVDAKWSDPRVRRVAASYGIGAITQRGPIQAWIVDDTGFPKQGKHSVGVQRQYSGTLGKTGNCQVGASLTVASRHDHLPIDFELYLPRSWADPPERREEARIPEDVPFRTKPQLALAMIRRAVQDGVPPGIVLADSAYGDSSDFRTGLRDLGLEAALGVHGPTKVWRVDRKGRRRGDPVSVGDLSLALAPKYRRTTWRQGTQKKLSSRFAAVRVVPVQGGGEHWLLCEWPEGDEAPSKFFLVTLPRTTTRKELVRVVKERYRTEQMYVEMKGELGLDHYEGRRFPGWHHHVSVALCCYAFIVAERARRFPPSAERQAEARAHAVAA